MNLQFRRSLLCISLSFCLINQSNAQIGPWLRAVVLNPNVYYTKTDLVITRYAKRDGELVTQQTYTLRPENGLSIRYKVVGTEGDYTLIKLLPRLQTLSDATIRLEDAKRTAIQDEPTDYLYFVETKKFSFNQKLLLSEKITGSPLVFPFKLRPQNRGEGSTLSTDVTIGYTFGVRFQLGAPYKQNFLTPIFYGAGLTSTKYFYQKTDGSYADKTDGVAITYMTFGLMLTLNKVNFGVFAGKDAMIDKHKNWAYQNDWWYSFGIGYKFKTD